MSDREEVHQLLQALGPNSINYDVKSSSELPSSLSSYLHYNAIIFDNIPGHLVGEEKMGIIEQAVKNFGVGFMMVGGENSFGLEGTLKRQLKRYCLLRWK